MDNPWEAVCKMIAGKSSGNWNMLCFKARFVSQQSVGKRFNKPPKNKPHQNKYAFDHVTAAELSGGQGQATLLQVKNV